MRKLFFSLCAIVGRHGTVCLHPHSARSSTTNYNTAVTGKGTTFRPV